MAVVNLIDRYAALARSRLDEAGPRQAESRSASGDSRFAKLLEMAMSNESTGASTSAGDNLDLLRQDFRHRMIATMLDHIETDAPRSSRLPWQPLLPPGGGEGENMPSNYRQGRESSDAANAAYAASATRTAALEAIIARAAQRFEVDPSLIRSVIKVESAGNAAATSPKGAMGLMQLMPATASDLGVARPYDPEENIMGGTRYLKMLLNRYGGNLEKTLAAYNWGMGNLEKKPDRMPAETRSYVAQVLQHYERMKA